MFYNYFFKGFDGKVQDNALLKLTTQSEIENKSFINKSQAVITTQPFSIFCDEDVSVKTSLPKPATTKNTSFLASACNLPVLTSLAPKVNRHRKPLSILNTLSLDVDEESNEAFEREHFVNFI